MSYDDDHDNSTINDEKSKYTVDAVKGKNEEKDKLFAVINEDGKAVGAFIAKQPYAFKEWVAMNQEARKTIALNHNLTGEDFRVLVYVEGILEYENFIPLSTAQIAKDLNMRQQNVSRAFKHLVAENIIIKGEKDGRVNTYVLNAWHGFKGKAKNHKKVAARHLRLVELNKPEDIESINQSNG